MKIKVSDYIVEFLISKGITDVFGYPGGMVTYLIDSFSKYKSKISNHLTYHEQGAAFAACGYAQVSRKVGVAYATSGPGATNLITGIANAYFDSIPCMFLTGQVNTYEQKSDLNCRQKGFQETDIISISKSVTKYSKMITDVNQVVYELEKAYNICKYGRQGPVLIDIPMNIQRQYIDTNEVPEFVNSTVNQNNSSNMVKIIYDKLGKAKKPVIIAGNGINLSNVKEEFRSMVEHIKIPILTTMISVDLLPESSNYKFGFVGTYGNRYANLILAKSDLIIALGTRLDGRQTGVKKDFNDKAELLRIEIDEGEIENRIVSNETCLKADLKTLIPILSKVENINNMNFNKWVKQCNDIKRKLIDRDSSDEKNIIAKLSEMIKNNVNITTDVGQNQVWVSQAFKIKKNQNILYSGGHGAMGYSLPASIGAYYADKKNIISFNGDGGLQMNIQELQFLAREKIPIKIIVLNNHSLGMIRHFQEMYFESNYALTTKGNGYEEPDFCKIAQAYGIDNYSVNKNNLIQIKEVLNNEKPVLININLSDRTYVFPKLGVDKPIYDQEPLLEREELKKILNK